MAKKPTSTRRPGKTETFSVSVDAQTKALLKAAADRWHGGNMSRLFTQLAQRLSAEAAFERAWAWYGGPTPTSAEIAEIDAWIDRVEGKPKKRRSRAA
jgi:hypothetical protein